MNYISQNIGKGHKKDITYLKRNEQKIPKDWIIGDTSLHTTKNEKIDHLNEQYAIRKHIVGITLGYIQVSDHQYIRLKTQIPLILFLLIGILLIPTLQRPSSPLVQGEPINTNRNQEPEEETEMTTVTGHGTQIITTSNPDVLLINDPENEVYFKYQLINEANDEILYTSEYIAPNSMQRVNIKNLLTPGEYLFTFHFDTFDIETLQPCSSGNEKSVPLIVK